MCRVMDKKMKHRYVECVTAVELRFIMTLLNIIWHDTHYNKYRSDFQRTNEIYSFSCTGKLWQVREFQCNVIISE